MTLRTALAAAVLALLASIAPAGAQDDVLARAENVNAGLHTFTATMHAHVALKTFPYLTTDIGATYYHKNPDLDKLEITSGLPGLAQQFSKLYPHIEPPARWSTVFNVTKSGDDGKVTTFKLVPKKQGNVDSIDARIDDASALVESMTWHYGNGGSASMINTYGVVKGFHVVTAQTGSVDEPSYKGDINATLSDYAINPALSDSIFSDQHS